MSFDSFGFCPAVLLSIKDQGYDLPTPVQERTIPQALTGKDLIVSAQTGSGKTAAFILPALQKFQGEPRQAHGPRMLILTPTRELARQVSKAAQTYARHCSGMRCVTILGGTPYGQQQRMLSRPFDIMVATPGRLLDLLDQGGISLANVQILVLDEADRMLDMGFIDDVDSIVQRTPTERQTLLFSATVEGDLARLAQRILKNPEQIQVNGVQEQHGNIEQKLYYSDDLSHKKALLTQILNQQDVDQAIVFTATKIDADQLAAELDTSGISCAALHGDMRQKMRNRTLEQIHARKIKVLVATDIAARGLDVPGISHVVNFDLPKVVEDYIHRIGRTGRGGRNGTAISLVSVRDRMLLARISQYTGQQIESFTIAGLEPRVRISEPRSVRRPSSPEGRFTAGRSSEGRSTAGRSAEGRDSFRRRDRDSAPSSRQGYSQGQGQSHGHSHSSTAAAPRPRHHGAAAASGFENQGMHYGAAPTHSTASRSAPGQRPSRGEHQQPRSQGYQDTPHWKTSTDRPEAGNRSEPRKNDFRKADFRKDEFRKDDRRPTDAPRHAPARPVREATRRQPWEQRQERQPGQFFSRMDQARTYNREITEEAAPQALKPKTTSKITYVSRSRLVKPES